MIDLTSENIRKTAKATGFIKDNVEKVQAGDYPGLKGKMIHIKHL